MVMKQKLWKAMSVVLLLALMVTALPVMSANAQSTAITANAGAR